MKIKFSILVELKHLRQSDRIDKTFILKKCHVAWGFLINTALLGSAIPEDMCIQLSLISFRLYFDNHSEYQSFLTFHATESNWSYWTAIKTVESLNHSHWKEPWDVTQSCSKQKSTLNSDKRFRAFFSSPLKHSKNSASLRNLCKFLVNLVVKGVWFCFGLVCGVFFFFQARQLEALLFQFMSTVSHFFTGHLSGNPGCISLVTYLQVWEVCYLLFS